jgi:hypothetical protein
MPDSRPVSEASALDIASLTLGLIGAVTGVVALLWNVVEFALAGPRIQVRLSEGRTDGFQLITGPGLWAQNPSYTGIELPYRVVAIEVTNRGRAAVTIASAGMKFTNGTEFHATDETNYRLDAHSSHTWRLPFETASAVVTTSRKSNMPAESARGLARLATGKAIVSKVAVRIPG